MKKIIFIIMLILLTGCTYKNSKAPYPVKHKASTQYELQAVSHWKLIAKDFSNSLKLPNKTPIYITKPKNNSPFAENFYQLLKVELINKNFILKTKPSKNDVIIDLKINVVKFNSNRNLKKFPYKMTLLTSGLWVGGLIGSTVTSPITGGALATAAIATGETIYNDKTNKFYDNPPKYEINIEAFAIKDNQYKTAASRIYYVADADSNLYINFPMINVKGDFNE